MRVAMDVSSAAKGDPTGIGRYIVELVRHLPAVLGPGDRVRLAVRLSRWRDRAHLAPLAAIPGVEPPAPLLGFLPGLLCRGMSLLHAAGMSLPRAIGVPAAATIHDIFTIDDPSLGAERFSERRTRKTAAVLARADLLFVVSAFVRERVLDRFPTFPADRIIVTHHGIDHAGLSEVPGPQDADVLRRHHLNGGPYVLCVGRVEHRKNPEGLVRGFARARAAAGATLVFAGQEGRSEVQEAVRETSMGTRVRFLGRIADEDLGPLYRGAAAFALPSRYEGFGIPLAEAFACGTPALASTATALPEVAAGAAELCELDPDAIAAGLDRVLDPSRSQELRRLGLARAKTFTWRRCAEATAAGYRRLLEVGKR